MGPTNLLERIRTVGLSLPFAKGLLELCELIAERTIPPEVAIDFRLFEQPGEASERLAGEGA